jgi:hypothetical protein
MFLEKITDIVADNFFDRKCQFEKTILQVFKNKRALLFKEEIITQSCLILQFHRWVLTN